MHHQVYVGPYLYVSRADTPAVEVDRAVRQIAGEDVLFQLMGESINDKKQLPAGACYGWNLKVPKLERPTIFGRDWESEAMEINFRPEEIGAEVIAFRNVLKDLPNRLITYGFSIEIRWGIVAGWM